MVVHPNAVVHPGTVAGMSCLARLCRSTTEGKGKGGHSLIVFRNTPLAAPTVLASQRGANHAGDAEVCFVKLP